MIDNPEKTLSPHIKALMTGLRWRIRAYVLLEGLALAVIWLGLTYWVGLGLDYLPVFLGATDVPIWARAIGLIGISVVLAYILYRWVLSRTFVRLRDHSMALLLERSYDDFHDSLLTSVEMSEHPDHAADFNEEMLEHTRAEALAYLDNIQLSKVFDFFPLMRNLIVALLLVGSVAAFALTPKTSEAFVISVQRNILLKDVPWPRRAKIEVVGVEVLGYEFDNNQNANDPNPKDGPPRRRRILVPFNEQKIVVAEGTSPVLVVRADTSLIDKSLAGTEEEAGAERLVKPDYCTAYFRTEQGSMWARMLQRVGGEKNWQQYALDAEPLKNIHSDVSFDVRGYDYRVNGYKIKVVDSPAVIQVELYCEYPEYLVNKSLDLFLPRTVRWTPGSRVQRGAKVKIQGRSNVELSKVHVFDRELQQTVTLLMDKAKDRKAFEFPVPSHDRNLALDFYLEDIHGQISKNSYLVTLGLIEDKVPVIEARLKGIGPFITPNARIPAFGPITDDYEVDRAWMEFEITRQEDTKKDPKEASKGEDDEKEVPRLEARSFEFPLGKDGQFDAAVDLRDEANRDENALVLNPGDQVAITIKAVDKFNLKGPGTNVGTGDRLEKTVVTPDALIVKLENREVGIRRRYEQIIMEMTQARDILQKVKTDTSNTTESKGAEPEDAVKKDGSEPEDALADGDTPEETNPLDQVERQQVRVQRVLQQSRKAAAEVMGIALAFDDIREELINNRIDIDDRKDRLEQKISKPLKNVAENMLPKLDGLLEKLDEAMGKPEDRQLATEAMEQADITLLEMNDILQEMLDMETFNELVDLLRELIGDQDKLEKMIKELRKRSVLEGL